MAEISRVRTPVLKWGGVSDVMLLRIAIVTAVLVSWELLASSGWFYAEIVPSLVDIARAVVATLTRPDFHYHLFITMYEMAVALCVGGFFAGISVGVVLGANRLAGRAYEPYIYYLGPTPKIILFPIAIMWFGIGPESKIAIGAVACFIPIALNVAAGMRQIDRVLIRVGRSFRANTWQMITKIYLPAIRYPILNGVRIGLGTGLISVLLAETKLSAAGLGFLVIESYATFDMPAMYALLIVTFTIAIAINTMLMRLAVTDRTGR